VSPISIQLLGDVSISRDGQRFALRRPQPRVVFALLVSQRHRVVTRHEIADLLWGDSPLPDHWAGAVRGVISKVRSFLAEAGCADWMSSAPDGWRIELDSAASIDVDVAASTFQGPGTIDLESLLEVDRSLAREFVPGATGSWVERRRDELGLLHRRTLETLTRSAIAAGRHDVARRASAELISLDPYSDLAAQLELHALAEGGDRRAALAAHDGFGRRLRDVGLAPDAVTEALAASIRGIDAPAGGSTTAIVGRNSRGLVGRRDELAMIAKAWSEVTTDLTARALIITGEPGAGKTRLAIEASRADGAGRTLWGRCSPERSVAYEPLSEAFVRAAVESPDVFASLGPLADHLSALVPELGAAPPDIADRSLLFRAATVAIRSLITAPSVWVIDDLQWATDDTAALLTHAWSMISDIPVLIVVTLRSSGGISAGPLVALTRAVPTTTVSLSGLDEADVVELLAANGVTDADAVSDEVVARTGGNPFFVQELSRAADAEGHLDPKSLPESLRSWIGQRVAELEPDAAAVLAAAAVLGDDVDIELLAQVSGSDDRTTVAHVGSLVAAGLLAESAVGPEVAFAHALTRDVVSDGLGISQRRLLHRRAADFLESAPEVPPARIARHLSLGGSGVDARAVTAMLASGEDALAKAAWSAADTWFDAVLERRAGVSPERIEALIGSGTALRALGDRPMARERLREALAASSSSSDARSQAAAALALVGGGARGVSDDLADDERSTLLAEALTNLAPTDDDLRVSLQVELATALLLTDRRAERDQLALDALDLARSIGRDDLLAFALLGSRVARFGPEHAEARLAEMDEVLALPRASRSHAITVAALMSRHEDALLIGDRRLAQAALADARRAVEESGHPYWRWVVETWAVLDHVIDGRLDDAETAAFAAASWQSEHPESMACLGVNIVVIRLFQGRAAEVVDLLTAAAAMNPQIPAYQAVLALCCAESGDLVAAEEHYRSFADQSFETIPEDTNRLLTLAVLAEVCVALGDQAGAEPLARALSPHAGRQVILNCFAGGGSYWGPVAAQLGQLTALAEEPEVAERWFDEAIAQADAFGAPLTVARILAARTATIGSPADGVHATPPIGSER